MEDKVDEKTLFVAFSTYLCVSACGNGGSSDKIVILNQVVVTAIVKH